MNFVTALVRKLAAVMLFVMCAVLSFSIDSRFYFTEYFLKPYCDY